MPVRVALVNDHELVVRGLSELLAPYRGVVEVVELDLVLPVAQGVDIALYDTFADPDDRRLAGLVAGPHAHRVAVYSWDVDPIRVAAALATGAAAYLPKALGGRALADALVAVHQGRRLVPPEVLDERGRGPVPGIVPVRVATPDAAGGDAAAQGDWPGRDAGLTPRESEVVALIVQGLSNAEISARTSLSINSVKTYIRHSYRKMGVTSRTNAVLWGIDHGFVTVPTRVSRP